MKHYQDDGLQLVQQGSSMLDGAQSSSGISSNALNLGVGNAPPVDLTKDANGRIKTPTKEGYKIYNEYKVKVRK